MWRDRLQTLRDRWLGDPVVRRRIERLPFGRTIANRHARRLFDIVTGFAQSQMIAAALESGLFEQLAKGPMPTDRLDAPASLVRAVEAMGLIERLPDRRVRLTIDGLVVATDPGIRAMIAHNRLVYRDLADPLAMLRNPGGGELARFWPYCGSAGAADDYSALMAASQSFVTGALLDAYRFGAHRRVMDVGGGDGTFLKALHDRRPSLRLTLAELPAVAAIARATLAEAIDVLAVDSGEPLPDGADLITLIRVLHDRDDDAALALLERVAAALPAGGALLIAEPMAHAGRDPVAVYFTAYFAAMGSGRLRSAKEIDALLQQAGFVPRRHNRLSPMLDLIVARRR